ncbi:MAG: alpha/beta hydrolase [Nocardioides sp.]
MKLGVKGWVALGVGLSLLATLVVGSAGFATWLLVREADRSFDRDGDPGRRGDSGRPRRAESPTPVDPDVTAAPVPELAPFYAQVLSWEGCREQFECAMLKVPLDYRDPSGETIEIALLRVPASGDRIGSLVINPGGPGAPGTSFAESTPRIFGDRLLESFDVVGFDPRGTGGSSPVDCVPDDELDVYVAADPDPDTSAEVADYVRSVKEIGRGCGERSGRLARHVSTAEAARDMDVLRAALRDGSLTYYGASYGTKLGATYAELFPKRVGRLVLDGAIDLSLEGAALGLQQAEGFETALRAYVENCVEETASCFLGDSVEEGLERIGDFLAEVEDEPLSTDLDGRRLEIGNAFYGVVAPLYQREAWSALSLALRQGFDGDGTTLLQFSDLYTSRGTDGYQDNSLEANGVINCLDSPGFTPAEKVPSTFAAYEKASPTFGRVFAWSAIGCVGYPVSPEASRLDVRAEGAAPILVVGTTRDPATPMRWAEALADQLDSGVLLRRDGDGHTAYTSDNECIDETVEDYLVDGTVPEDGKTC